MAHNFNLVASHYTLAGTEIRTPSPRSLQQRLLAAESAGYTGIGIDVLDTEQLLRDRVLQKNLLSWYDRTKVSIQEAEIFWRWVDLCHDRRRVLREFDKFRALNELFGPLRLTLGPPQDAINVSENRALQEALQYLDGVALSEGMTLALEFQHGSGIKNLDQVDKLFSGLDLAVTGLVIDSWHFFRALHNPTELAKISSHQLLALQLSDGAFRPPTGLSAFEDSVSNRLVPGDGEFPLISLIGEAVELWPDLDISVEVINPHTINISVDDFAAYSYKKTTDLVEKALDGLNQQEVVEDGNWCSLNQNHFLGSESISGEWAAQKQAQLVEKS